MGFNLIKGKWIKLSVAAYVMCLLWYNFFGTSSPGYTNFYYTAEKGFAFLSLCFDYNKDRLTDKLFIDFARTLQLGTWAFFIMCSFMNEWWVYHQTFVVSIIILSTFGSLFVFYLTIRRKFK